jgi:TonB family protein
MNTILIYTIKAAFYLAGFYLIYSIFLSKDTKYGRNRAFIILSVVSAFILPLITINVKEQSSIYYFGKTLSEVFVTADGQKGQIVEASENIFSSVLVLFKIYLTGIIVFSLKLLTDIVSLVVLIIRNKKKNEHIIYFSGYNTAGFSAMGYIFINRSLSQAEADEVIRHEQNHLDQNHFLDILLIELTMIFQWFNPVIYFFNRSLRAIHEYQADQGYLRSGIPVISYQNLLLRNVFRSGKINISNSFSNPSLIKKRMIMMTKKRTPAMADLKILLVLPVMFLLLASFSNFRDSKKSSDVESVIAPLANPVQSDQETSKEVFKVVDEMPIYPGGDKALMKFISDNVVYPKTAKEKNIQGNVIVRFIVGSDGIVRDAEVFKKVNPDLDAEALRVVNLMPKWQPGLMKGKPVNVYFNLPFMFKLK